MMLPVRWTDQSGAAHGRRNRSGRGLAERHFISQTLSEFPYPEWPSIIDLVAKTDGVVHELPRQLGAIPAAYPPVIVARGHKHNAGDTEWRAIFHCDGVGLLCLLTLDRLPLKEAV